MPGWLQVGSGGFCCPNWTWSWHDVQTAMVFPIVTSSPWSVTDAPVETVVSCASAEIGGWSDPFTWHMLQFATPCGVSPGNSFGVPGAPPVAAFAPLNPYTMSGSCRMSAEWTPWIMYLKSIGVSVPAPLVPSRFCKSVACGLWQTTQVSTLPFRLRPCADTTPWQTLQLST